MCILYVCVFVCVYVFVRVGVCVGAWCGCGVCMQVVGVRSAYLLIYLSIIYLSSYL